MPPKHASAGGSHGARGGVASTSKAPKTAPSRSKAQVAQSTRTADLDNSELDPFADEVSPPRRTKDSIDIGRGRDHADANGGGGGGGGGDDDDDDDDEVEAKKTIPPELLTRILHEFFEKDGTRISKDANKAVAKYMDIFVREAIARTAVEKGSGFLEVEDLEKIAPQLLMDL